MDDRVTRASGQEPGQQPGQEVCLNEEWRVRDVRAANVLDAADGRAACSEQEVLVQHQWCSLHHRQHAESDADIWRCKKNGHQRSSRIDDVRPRKWTP